MKKKKKPSTALVRRKPTALAKRILPSPQAVAMLTDRHILGEEASTEGLGLQELKLTDSEEAILSMPVNVDHVLVKPTGQVYLSHPSYIGWFNRAFGRLGWRLVPNAKPRQSDTGVLCPYILYIHGVPVAFVWGEQDYHENNKEQTYGDAIEATRASALRRCAKQLGVGLELWDKRWTRSFEQNFVVKVFTKDKEGKAKAAFRLKTDPPFWNESGVAGQPRSDESRGQPKTERSVVVNPHDNEPITDKQRDRFWGTARRMHRTEAEIRVWLAAQGITSTKDIKRKDYEDICHALEHPGHLQDPNPTGKDE